MAEQIKCDINLLKILSNFHTGIHPNTALNLYKSLILSKINYSAPISLISNKKNIQIIQTIKNSALRTALGLAKSTPVPSILDLAATTTSEIEIEK